MSYHITYKTWRTCRVRPIAYMISDPFHSSQLKGGIHRIFLCLQRSHAPLRLTIFGLVGPWSPFLTDCILDFRRPSTHRVNIKGRRVLDYRFILFVRQLSMRIVAVEQRSTLRSDRTIGLQNLLVKNDYLKL